MSQSDAKKDRWIPGLFIAFFVGLACLQIWFVALAQTTFSGMVTDYAQDTPLGREGETKNPGGWKHSIRLEDQDSLRGRLVLVVRNADERPLAGASVQASAERMSRFPQILPLRFQERESGVFEADLTVPLGGSWFVRLDVAAGGTTASWIEEVEVAP